MMRRESGLLPDLLDHLADLVDAAAVCRRPGAPLVTVDGTEIAVLVGPFVPDRHLVLVQVADIGVTLQEPQQLVQDRAQVHLLGGDQRETRGQVEAHLVAEHADGTGPGTVFLANAVLAHVAHQVQVLFHCFPVSGFIDGALTSSPCRPCADRHTP